MEIFHEKAIFDRTVYMPGMTEVGEVLGVGNYVNVKSIYIYILFDIPIMEHRRIQVGATG